jgi:hypothetical protein
VLNKKTNKATIPHMTNIPQQTVKCKPYPDSVGNNFSADNLVNFTATHSCSCQDPSPTTKTKESIKINLGTVVNTEKSFLTQSDLHEHIHKDFESILSKFLNEDKNFKNDITISLIINKIEYKFDLPDHYINNRIIPSLIIPFEIFPVNGITKKNKYFINLGNNKLEIVYYAIIIDNKNVLIIPIDIIQSENFVKVNITYKYKKYCIFLNDNNFIFYYPCIEQNKIKCIYMPYFIDLRYPYPKQIYNEIEKAYLENMECTQREVCEIIKSKYNLVTLSHSTLSRHLKDRYITQNNLDMDILNNQLDDVTNFDEPRRCSFWTKKKLKTKFKYNLLKLIIQHKVIDFYVQPIIVINKIIIKKLLTLEDKFFLQLTLSCTNIGDYPP